MDMEMLATRTPLKARNQEFTPALGKRQANRTMFATPTKRMMTATPQLSKKMNFNTPSKMIFKKPRKSPTLKLPVKTPGKLNLYKHASTPGKFTVFEDSEDDVLREMKRKNFKIEQPEVCPWANKNKETLKSDPVPPLEIIDDYSCREPSRKKICPIRLDPLPVSEQEELQFNFDTEYPLPSLTEDPEDKYSEPELCPWASMSADPLNTTTEEIELELSTLSDLDITKERLSQISIRCFNESYRDLEDALSEDELPEMPSTPELDQELQELLELSFDTFHL